MKKTLLATAIAGALGVSAAAQAATVYDQDGTQVDVYGRLIMGLTTGGTDTTNAAGDTVRQSGSDFEDFNSRFGLRARHQVNTDLSVFANAEFRFNAAERQRDGEVINSNRSTFVGVNSQQFGRVQVGNFNSMYYNAVTAVFDVPENLGWESIGGVDNSSHGRSIAYSTPVLEGFQAHLQAKHYTGNDQIVGVEGVGADIDSGSTTSLQAAINYTWQDLYLAVAYDQNRDFGVRPGGGETGNSGENIWGAVAQYQFTPAFSARLGYETTSTDDAQYEATIPAGATANIDSQYLGQDITSVGATFDYGMGEIYGQYSRISYDAADISSANRWMLGANYRFSQPMYVFAEVYDADFDTDARISDINDDVLYTLGVRYDF
ncbi:MULTISPECIES: porin [Halomonadaceae]|uniref:porin n=1 Tax=Halomonadaceae TaxID=28256 RepID=UPI0015990FDD|nr:MULTISPECIES: porin [Halomonas]QJQ96883.1 porin [Halomonas sp. PA5]